MIEIFIKNEESLKKWSRFKSNKLAVLSLFIILVSLFFSLTAEFWANSKPI
jgi:microcin C transport system permease protein